MGGAFCNRCRARGDGGRGAGAAAEESSAIGYLVSTDPATESARSEAIRLALRELGYVEGQNIDIEYRYSEGKIDRASDLAAEVPRIGYQLLPPIPRTRPASRLSDRVCANLGIWTGEILSLSGGTQTGNSIVSRPLRPSYCVSR